jgi:hypothetical protein
VVPLPAKPVYSAGREYKCLGYPDGGGCDDWAVDVRCYNVKDSSVGEAIKLLPQITPLCEACVRMFDKKIAMGILQAKNQRYRKKSDQLEASQRDLETCQNLLSERDVELAARDAEVTQLREEMDVMNKNSRNSTSYRLREMKTTRFIGPNSTYGTLTAQIQELKDTQRDMEEQLEEANDNSADVAHAITAGANIMMAEQFTQTQQNYADLRRHIERIRAEHAAFVLEAQKANAATAASSRELEQVMSDLSDETYMTANSTYDASDD